MKNAICLITHKPNEKISYLHFINKFIKYVINVIIDVNLNNFNNLKKQFTNIRFIQINDELCFNSGFKNISYITLKKPITGWDKAIYFFTKENTNYENVWFFEDDVYFHSENTILQIDNKYKDEDILCNSSYGEGKLNEWLWKRIKINFYPPYFCGMMCALRLSKKYINCIRDYIDKNKTMFFLEAFFPTIAVKNNLKIFSNPIEFLTITHRNSTPNPTDININYLYHPVKDLNLHNIYRNIK